MRLRKNTKSELVAPDSFTIHRDKWLMDTSERHLGDPYMLSQDGNMCCLGFYAHACGVGSQDLMDRVDPEAIVKRVAPTPGPGLVEEFPFYNIPLLTTLRGATSVFATNAIHVNDWGHNKSTQTTYTLQSREEAIKKHFAKKDVTVKFVGKYPKEVIAEDEKRRQGEYDY